MENVSAQACKTYTDGQQPKNIMPPASSIRTVKV